MAIEGKRVDLTDEQQLEVALRRIVAGVLSRLSYGDLIRDAGEAFAVAVAWVVQTGAGVDELADHVDPVAVRACGDGDYGRAIRISWVVAGMVLRFAAVMDDPTRRRLLRDEDGQRMVAGMKCRAGRRGKQRQAGIRPRGRTQARHRPRERRTRTSRGPPSAEDPDCEHEPASPEVGA